MKQVQNCDPTIVKERNKIVGFHLNVDRVFFELSKEINDSLFYCFSKSLSDSLHCLSESSVVPMKTHNLK